MSLTNLPFFAADVIIKDSVLATINILLDTGSNVSLIDHKILPKSIYIDKNHRISFITANGSSSTSLGTVALRVKPIFRTTSNANTILVHFHVVPFLQIGCLLGLDCLNKSSIDIKTKFFKWTTVQKHITVKINTTIVTDLVCNAFIPSDNAIFDSRVDQNLSKIAKLTNFTPTDQDLKKLIPASLDDNLQTDLFRSLDQFKKVFVETSRPALFKFGHHKPLVLPLTSEWIGLPKSYPFPNRLNQVLLDQINTWLEDDVIEIQPDKNVPYRTNILPIQKSDSTYRIVLDCRHINSAIKPEVVYLPPPIKMVAEVATKKFISSLDISSFFLSFRLDPKSRDLLTFSDPAGRLYRPKNTPFGLKWSMGNAVNMLTSELTALHQHHKWLRQFVDDLTIFDDCPFEHLKHISLILELLSKLNLKIKTSSSYDC